MVGLVIDLCEPRKLLLVAVVFLFFCGPTTLLGQSTEPPERDFDSIEALIEILKSKGVMSEDEARSFVERYRQTQTAPEKDRRVVRIVPEEGGPRVEEGLARDFTQEMKRDVGELKEEVEVVRNEILRRTSENERKLTVLETKLNEDLAKKVYKSSWAQRIRFGGDIRLRYQGDYFDKNNAPFLDPSDPSQLINTHEDRHRMRYRVRISAKATIVDPREEVNIGKVEIGARLATGNDDDPVSTNDTLGDYQNKDSIVLDRGYLKWKYQPLLPVWGGKIPEIALTGGRMANPWFSSDLVWDSDVNFEGVSLGFQTDTLMSNPWSAFLTTGAFSIQEEDFYSDKWLYGGQAGIQYKKTMGLTAKLGAAYYHYDNIKGKSNVVGRANENDYTAPEFQQKGNTLMNIATTGTKFALATDYHLVNLTGKLDYDYWFPIHIILLADYVKNVGYDREEVRERTGADIEETDGYQIGLTVGYPEIRNIGEWNTFLFYKYLEADAVLDAFTDSDFHLGGTNAQGWILGAQFGLFKDVWLSGRWITADEIERSPLAVDTLQLDVNARF